MPKIHPQAAEPSPELASPAILKAVVAGLGIQIPSRYAAGHVLSELEAKVLNQTYLENIRNNRAPIVKKAFEEHGGTLPSEVEAKLQQEILAYAQGYTFASPKSPRLVADPVELEARKIAKSALANALAKRGQLLKAYAKDWVEAKIEELIKTRPQYMEQARLRVAQLKALTSEGLEELMPTAEAAPAAAAQ